MKNVFCVLGKHESCPKTGCDCACHASVEQSVVLIDESMIAKADEKTAAILEEIKEQQESKEVEESQECEACPNIFPKRHAKKIGNIIMCPECYEKEIALQAANNTPEAQQARVDAHNKAIEIARQSTAPVLSMNRILRQGRELDSQIQVRTDIFNAQTVAIEELRKAIDSDISIENKPLALATELDARYQKLKTVVFELNQQVIEKTNEQKALQTYLNQLVNKLRLEEREKFKQHDLTYEPKAPAKPKVAKGPKKHTIDKVELSKFSKELGLPPSVLQMMVVSRNISLEEAFKEMKKTLMK